MNENNNLDTVSNNTNFTLHIGDRAPLFNANSTHGNLKLSDYKGNWLILFSHPGSFTPICTTEFIAFSNMHSEFEKRNCKLLGLSVDSNTSHLAWVNNIHKMTGTQIPFPIIADSDMAISKKYGMLAPNVSNTKTVRNVLFIDPKQIVRAILIYPMSNGRNINELLRLLDAMQMTDNENVSTPANWMPGYPTVMPAPTTYSELIERVNSQNGFNCMDWYLCFNEDKNIQNIPMKNIYNNLTITKRY